MSGSWSAFFECASTDYGDNTMTQEIDLSLPQENRKTVVKIPKPLVYLNILILLAILADIGLGVWLLKAPFASKTEASLSAAGQKELALKLEKQSLNTAAISAWKQYLAVAGLNDPESAGIWYRIGKLYQQDRQYEPALGSYYRSESFATVSGLSPEISRRVEECLESMGKFAALRYELSDRVGLQKSAEEKQPVSKGDEVVAEIGPEKITKSDLDQWIELQIDRQLSQMVPYLPDDKLKQQKEALLKKFSGASQRQTILNQLLMEEILYRKASASKLLEDPKVQEEIRQQERALLAKEMIEKEFADKINITEGDLKTYYEAHRKDYITGETAKISQILVPDPKERPRSETGWKAA